MPPSGWLNDPNGVCRIDGPLPRLLPAQPGRAGARRRALGTRQLDRPAALDGRADRPRHPARGARRQRLLVGLRGRRRRGADRGLHRRPDHAWNAGSPSPAATGRCASGSQDPVGQGRDAGRPGDQPRSAIRSCSRFGGHRYAVQGAGHHDRRPAAAALRLRRSGRLDVPRSPADHRRPGGRAVAPANIWECPNLFQLGDRWVLLLSQWRHVDGTHELAGVRYLVGDLVPRPTGGLRFVAESGGTVDDGPTFYAPAGAGRRRPRAALGLGLGGRAAYAGGGRGGRLGRAS